jgi:hypothetical protein
MFDFALFFLSRLFENVCAASMLEEIRQAMPDREIFPC